MANGARELDSLPVIAPLQTSTTIFLSKRIRQLHLTEDSSEINVQLKDANKHWKADIIEVNRQKQVRAIDSFGIQSDCPWQ